MFLFFSFLSHPKLKFRKMTLLESEACSACFLFLVKQCYKNSTHLFTFFRPFQFVTPVFIESCWSWVPSHRLSSKRRCGSSLFCAEFNYCFVGKILQPPSVIGETGRTSVCQKRLNAQRHVTFNFDKSEDNNFRKLPFKFWDFSQSHDIKGL